MGDKSVGSSKPIEVDLGRVTTGAPVNGAPLPGAPEWGPDRGPGFRFFFEKPSKNCFFQLKMVKNHQISIQCAKVIGISSFWMIPY